MFVDSGDADHQSGYLDHPSAGAHQLPLIG